MGLIQSTKTPKHHHLSLDSKNGSIVNSLHGWCRPPREAEIGYEEAEKASASGPWGMRCRGAVRLSRTGDGSGGVD